MKCKICGNEQTNKVIYAKDMNYGGNKEFKYFQCSKCKCLQLDNIPENIEQYYGSGYYSLNMKKHKRGISEKLISSFLKIRDKQLLLSRKGIISKICCKMQPRIAYELIPQLCPNKNAAILDVGCGDGYLLKLMFDLGWKNLYGVDLYGGGVENEQVKLKKGTIFDITGQFDLVMFHHSFEHMEQPLDILKKVNSLLRDKNSSCIICIPISTCYVFEKYGKNWVQLDAPRHFFLHSPDSIKLMARKSNLYIEKIIYDSNSFQIIGSEMYKRGELGIKRRTLKNTIKYVFESVVKYSRIAEQLNQKEKGDQAIFVLHKV